MRVLRVLYGCIETALAWYSLFIKTLQQKEYTLSLYDKCVANKIINDEQCTNAWHVNDCLTSHVEQKVLDELRRTVIKHFGDMKINTEPTHDFLGMNTTITKDSKVKTDMRQQIHELIKDFETKNDIILHDPVTSPCTDKLFTVDKALKT